MSRPQLLRAQRGPAYPLGVTVADGGVQVAVFSAHAEKIQFCLFDERGHLEAERWELPECTDGVWHGFVPGVTAGRLYGLRADGPYQPEAGHRFNAHKLLVDPYAKALCGTLRWGDEVYGYRVGAPGQDLSFCRRDSASAMPKAVVVADSAGPEGWNEDRAPRRLWSETVIYETHLRGFTKQRGDLPGAQRGTWSALGDQRSIEHLQRLGVSAVELLPVQAFVSEPALAERGFANYWGYNPLCWFAPHPAYLASGSGDEIRRAVQALHAAGIELILDVVYNHTAEGGVLGPTLSLRGLDHASYYVLSPASPRYCADSSGCGNSLDFSHPRSIQLVMDSLRHWVREYHVDGFRFDLSVTLAREGGAYDAGAGFFDALLQDPLLAQCKLIAEPWDVGPHGYQLGRHPAGFAEWNGRYRDDVRRFWRGDAGQRGALAARLQGSADLFDHARRRPWASVNFITAHDGFTLRDLVSYAHKHNDANGEDNRDGADDNASQNCGVEGETDDLAILERRGLIQRALLATLLVSHGTPMLLGGDEFGRTQAGNNNAYCHDDPLNWFDWTQIESAEGRALASYVARLIALRRDHPSLHGERYHHGREEYAPGLRDIAWFDESGEAMDESRWTFYEGRLLALRRVAKDERGALDASLVLINNTAESRHFVLPPPLLGWQVALDSAEPARAAASLQEPTIEVPARAVVLLVAAAGMAA